MALKIDGKIDGKLTYALWGLIKNKGGVGLFKFHKGRDFFIFYDNQVLLGTILQCGPPSCTLQNRPFLS